MNVLQKTFHLHNSALNISRKAAMG